MKKYTPFFKTGMMEEMAYKAGIFAWLIITILQLSCIIFLWVAVYSNATTDVINGFTFKQMIVYFVFTNIFEFTCLGSQTLHDINTEIKDGTIAISFIKPISYRLRFLFRCMGGCASRVILMGIPGFTIAYIIFVKMGYIKIGSVPVFLIHIVLFLISMVLAAAIYDTVDYICGVCCFYTTAAFGLNQAKEVAVNFLSGVLIPLSFFPGNFGKIAEILPFAGLSQNPIYILTQTADIKTSVFFIVKSVVWFVILGILAKGLFYHASKKITVQGG